MQRMALVILAVMMLGVPAALNAEDTSLTLERSDHFLVIHGPQIPGGSIRINYLEAYCRAGSTDADWGQHTVIPHTSERVSLSTNRKVLKLRDTLADGVIVEHT